MKSLDNVDDPVRVYVQEVCGVPPIAGLEDEPDGGECDGALEFIGGSLSVANHQNIAILNDVFLAFQP